MIHATKWFSIHLDIAHRGTTMVFYPTDHVSKAFRRVESYTGSKELTDALIIRSKNMRYRRRA